MNSGSVFDSLNPELSMILMTKKSYDALRTPLEVFHLAVVFLKINLD